MSRENLISLFEEFERFARDTAVVQRAGYRRQAHTYRELSVAAVGWAQALKARNVRTGDPVLLWGANSFEWMAAFWGCLLRGAVAVPMDHEAQPEFAARVVQDAGVKLILAASDKVPLCSGGIPVATLDEVPGSAPASPALAGSHGASGIEYDALADEPLTRSRLAEILYTSGTTAEPRGVALTHGNFLANLEPLERGIGPYRKYERWLHPLRFVSLVPLSHVFGQFMSLFVPPLLGSTVVFVSSQQPADILRVIKRERATALVAVPRMLDALRNTLQREIAARGWQSWFERAERAAAGESFLRRAWRFRRFHRLFGWKFWALISGGAALPAPTEEFFKRLGFAVVQGYGMTETASLISLNHPFRAAEGTIGKVLPGREFRLAEDGEILVRGENVSAGYWAKGSLAPAGDGVSASAGWLRTGDLGELDSQGNLRFRGRKKNVIVTPAGLNVYPEDLEAALRTQSDVRDCVVVPVSRDGNAEPHAVLLLEPGVAEARDGAAKTALEQANRSLAEYQRIRNWTVWPELDFPRTAAGKPRIGVIAARIAEGVETIPKDSAGPAAPGIEDLIRTLSHSGAANAGTQLENDLNLSSLDRIELMNALEQKFQIELSDASFSKARTLGDVQRLLHEPAAAAAPRDYPRWAQFEPVRWLRLAVYYALVWPATLILAHPRVVGSEHLDKTSGPLLFVSNHVASRADIGLVLWALPPRFRHRLAAAMAGETLGEMQRPPRDWFFAKRWVWKAGYWLVTALFNVFPLPQYSGFRESFRFAGELADRGCSVLVFPEGQVNNSEDGRMAPFRPGAGLLAQNLNVPIVPMRLDGVWKMKKQRRRLARIGEIIIRIGAPVNFAPGTPPEGIARQLEDLVRNL
jgi:long-chain acyl-CoA synthetase